MVQANWQPTKAEDWKNFPSPARPWPSEVAWFEKYVLEKKKKGKVDVLILGSTVEFRSMCHKNDVNVYIADFSQNFYEILSKQPMTHRGAETFYEVDWRDMDLKKQFDLIFGDWVPGVLHTKDYDVFFKNIVKHLKDDGLFLGRECLRPESKPVDIEKVAKEHYEKYAEKYNFYNTSMQYIYSYGVDSKTSMWNMEAANGVLDMLYKKQLLKENDYQFFKDRLKCEKHKASIVVQKDFDHEVEKYFKIIAKHFGKEPSAPWYPIYVLGKK